MAGGSESNEDEIWNYKSGRKNKETNPAVLSCEVQNKCTSVINNDVQVEKTSDLKQGNLCNFVSNISCYLLLK